MTRYWNCLNCNRANLMNGGRIECSWCGSGFCPACGEPCEAECAVCGWPEGFEKIDHAHYSAVLLARRK